MCCFPRDYYRNPYVIEMAPAWGVPAGGDRGVARVGPVGLRALGRWRFFRYEVRCWPDGTLPDRQWAQGGPTVLTRDRAVVRALIDHVAQVPVFTWGRSVGTTGDMWNSNSLVAWLVVSAGLDPSSLQPPDGGAAPGWRAGLAVARGVHRTGAAGIVGG